ncbi:GntR family transcriptional regulator YhfZ [Fonticella tunisiensis]|uniref:Helix-turn-helix protein n=1 Tax=Fonticella tunisiensis TaxID=1096341 RepID=A0A4R7KQ93_9CLOT|nr:GntR family transcriptional regulator YhfZ [Fonticella tunisiensis]TDT61330.1 helix-turn-helix protein [Fonticella tunisiensis]
MSIKTQLLQKNGLVAMKLAREFITMNVGDRISTIAEYSYKYKTARGTVQSAIKLLEEYKAIRLEPRGHLGTFISSIDYEILWEFTDFGTITGVMPLPYSKLYEGLATGLYKVASHKKFPFSIAYMRGAETRIRALKDGRYDFAIVSKLAALYSIKNGVEVDIAVEFGKYSYVNEHVIIFSDSNDNTIKDGMKVGIDKSSIDHYLLTLEQCKGKKVNLIDLSYSQLILKLTTGEIDAAIWNIDEIVERKLDIKHYPLKNNDFNGEDTEAVIVVNKNNYGIKKIFEQFINSEEVLEYQRKVVRGELIPNY